MDTSSSFLSNNQVPPTDDALKLVIVCVGLPARGKSYITKKLQRYLNWMQYNTKIFNVGNTRRQLNIYVPSKYPIQGPTLDHSTPMQSSSPSIESDLNNKDNNNSNGDDNITENIMSHDSNLFDHSNKQNFQLREQWAKETLDHLLDYLLSDDGNVGIFDATNTTKARRRWIVETINKRTKGLVKILFLESICTDLDLIEKNIHLKLSGPDYKKMDPEKALKDFRNRLINYEKVYETIDEDEETENEKFDIQYVKIINAGKKVISYNISGYLSSQCVFFLLNFNLTDRQIWLTPNGESLFNVENRLGGDSHLTKKGIQFAKALPKFISKKRKEFKLKQLDKEFINDTTTFKTNKSNHINNFNIWTSTLKRTIETAHYFPRDEFYFKSFKILNDLGCGLFDSIDENDFRYLHPNDYLESLDNKLSYRYPGNGGESYLDVISRLRPIIIELERLKDHVLIISHRVIIRVLLCYFMNLNKEMLTELEVQHNYIYCIEPKPYGLDLNIWQYDDLTDMFIEVDVAEIMKRKRKRSSNVLNDVEKLRRFLLRHHVNYDSDDILSSQNSLISGDDDETGSDDDDDDDDDIDSDSESLLNSNSNSNSKQSIHSPKALFERSDSQAYEFSKDSSIDLKTLSPTLTATTNPRLKNSLSTTSMASIGSIPSCTSLTNMANLVGVSSFKSHLKGSSSDLRGQAIQAAQAAHVAQAVHGHHHLPHHHHTAHFHIPSSTNDLTIPSSTSSTSLSRKSSTKHIKKPSIDWDIYDHSNEREDLTTATNEMSDDTHVNRNASSMTPLSFQTQNTLSTNSSTNIMKLTRLNSCTSSGTSASYETQPSLTNLDQEVELIMSNSLLMNKLITKMKEKSQTNLAQLNK